MSDFPTPPDRIHWPDGLSTVRFLAEYWQQKPLLIRQAFPGFETPLPGDELAGLSLEPDTTPRLIRRDDNGQYWLAHGPFDEETFASLGTSDYSLLVTDVEKHLPELQAWIDPFRFVPDWRFDDLMISYAPDGASVGAHIDQYDVFLMQASGTRRWSIDTRSDVSHHQVADGDLRLLTDFEASETWDLEPGDLLYLPPGVPHHGVAVGDDCTTWSIGYRAPSVTAIVTHVAERICDSLEQSGNAGRLLIANEVRLAPGEISPQTVDAIESLWQEHRKLDATLRREIAGTLLTGGGSSSDIDDAGETLPADHNATYVVDPFARLAWIADSDRSSSNVIETTNSKADASSVSSVRMVDLFANGEAYRCSRELAIALCSNAMTGATELDENDYAVLDALAACGVIARQAT